MPSCTSYCKIQSFQTIPCALTCMNVVNGKSEEDIGELYLASGDFANCDQVLFALLAWSSEAEGERDKSVNTRVHIGSTAYAALRG